MARKLRLCGTEPESIVDGKGIRFVVFVQGCPHRCPGCHNPQSHPFEGGREADVGDLFEEIRSDPLLKGVTFSGGEPFCQPAPLAELAEMVRGLGLDVTTFTGYLYEDLLARRDPDVDRLLSLTDTLIDGPFLLAQKDLSLVFRGSRNQRVIDLNATRLLGGPVLLHPEEE
jgi:anaerobic ribonucleoside-triphosphate reductase activating protein